MSSSNCCFLTCVLISQEASQVVWNFHLFQNFSQFMIYIVKDFGAINKAEVDVFLELPCFSDDPADVGNLISGSSAFSGTFKDVYFSLKNPLELRRAELTLHVFKVENLAQSYTIHPRFPGRPWGSQWSPRLLTLVGAQRCVLPHLPSAPLPCTWVPARGNTQHTLPRCTLLYFQRGLYPESQPSSLFWLLDWKKRKM